MYAGAAYRMPRTAYRFKTTSDVRSLTTFLVPFQLAEKNLNKLDPNNTKAPISAVFEMYNLTLFIKLIEFNSTLFLVLTQNFSVNSSG